MFRPTLLLTCLSILGGCTPGVRAGSGWRPSEDITGVWRAAIDSYFGEATPHGRLYLQPQIGGFGDQILPLDSAAQRQITDLRLPLALHLAWLEANVDAVRLTAPPAIGPYRFRLLRAGERLPLATPVYELTFPGFSSNRDTAFVKFGQSCGFVCGSDIIFRVTRDPAGTWEAVPLMFMSS